VLRVTQDLDRVELALPPPALGPGLVDTLLVRARPQVLAALVALAAAEVSGQGQGQGQGLGAAGAAGLGLGLGLGHPGRAALWAVAEEARGEAAGCALAAPVAAYLRGLDFEEGRLLQRMAAALAVTGAAVAVRVVGACGAKGYTEVLLEEVGDGHCTRLHPAPCIRLCNRGTCRLPPAACWPPAPGCATEARAARRLPPRCRAGR
jgi:hypothetical protein